MTASRRSVRMLCCVATLTAAVAAAVWLVLPDSGEPPGPSDPPDRPGAPPAADVLSPPPLSASPFLNTLPEATYVGSETCATCHVVQHGTYLETAHSRALGDVDPDDEPPDAEFHHAASGRTYRVYREDGRLRHRESIRDGDGQEIVLGDFPMKYLVGSGRHSRTYVVEADGFLVESPVTWYASREAWDMSPGYDRPQHLGFERAVDVGCLFCHAGRVDSVDLSLHRLRFHEQTIGCENCHGPGSLHVAKHGGRKSDFRGQENKARGPRAAATAGSRSTDGGQRPRLHDSLLTADEFDNTIVHPGRLSRELNEAICAQCHLRGEATVSIRGRSLTDFRPGLPLSDFRVDYGLEHSDGSMKVVGHVEQMRLSRCYTESQTLTCTTCHHPHDQPVREQASTYYRQKCLSCHAVESCGIEREHRLERTADDNCATCHMPQVPTDIPHIAFTHHRIAVHTGEPASTQQRTTDHRPPTNSGRLVPLAGLTQLPEIERDHCLGLAYLELSDKAPDAQAFEIYRRRAHELLGEVHSRGVRDAEVNAALARIHWDAGSPQALDFAEAALRAEAFDAKSRVNALLIAGDMRLEKQRPDLALQPLEQLVRSRRHSEDWLLLGISRQRTGDATGALDALTRASKISPTRPDLHEILSELHRAAGNTALAEEHRRLARFFSRE